MAAKPPLDRTTSNPPSLIPAGEFAEKPPIPLKKAVVVIGSDEQCHLRLLSSTISRFHALIVSADDGVYIHDLASRTKVVVNGRPMQEAELSNGDELRLGRFAFKFTSMNAAIGLSLRAEPASLQWNGTTTPFALNGRALLVGRASDAEVCLSEDAVSARHAVIFEGNGKRYIRDLGTRTGTFVNGEKIHQKELKVGDSVQVGRTTLNVLAGAAAPARAEALHAPLPAVPAPAPAPAARRPVEAPVIAPKPAEQETPVKEIEDTDEPIAVAPELAELPPLPMEAHEEAPAQPAAAEAHPEEPLPLDLDALDPPALPIDTHEEAPAPAIPVESSHDEPLPMHLEPLDSAPLPVETHEPVKEVEPVPVAEEEPTPPPLPVAPPEPEPEPIPIALEPESAEPAGVAPLAADFDLDLPEPVAEAAQPSEAAPQQAAPVEASEDEPINFDRGPAKSAEQEVPEANRPRRGWRSDAWIEEPTKAGGEHPGGSEVAARQPPDLVPLERQVQAVTNSAAVQPPVAPPTSIPVQPTPEPPIEEIAPVPKPQVREPVARLEPEIDEIESSREPEAEEEASPAEDEAPDDLSQRNARRLRFHISRQVVKRTPPRPVQKYPAPAPSPPPAQPEPLELNTTQLSGAPQTGATASAPISEEPTGEVELPAKLDFSDLKTELPPLEPSLTATEPPVMEIFAPLISDSPQPSEVSQRAEQPNQLDSQIVESSEHPAQEITPISGLEIRESDLSDPRLAEEERPPTVEFPDGLEIRLPEATPEPSIELSSSVSGSAPQPEVAKTIEESKPAEHTAADLDLELPPLSAQSPAAVTEAPKTPEAPKAPKTAEVLDQSEPTGEATLDLDQVLPVRPAPPEPPAALLSDTAFARMVESEAGESTGPLVEATATPPVEEAAAESNLSSVAPPPQSMVVHEAIIPTEAVEPDAAAVPAEEASPIPPSLSQTSATEIPEAEEVKLPDLELPPIPTAPVETAKIAISEPAEAKLPDLELPPMSGAPVEAQTAGGAPSIDFDMTPEPVAPVVDSPPTAGPVVSLPPELLPRPLESPPVKPMEALTSESPIIAPPPVSAPPAAPPRSGLQEVPMISLGGGFGFFGTVTANVDHFLGGRPIQLQELPPAPANFGKVAVRFDPRQASSKPAEPLQPPAMIQSPPPVQLHPPMESPPPAAPLPVQLPPAESAVPAPPPQTQVPPSAPAQPAARIAQSGSARVTEPVILPPPKPPKQPAGRAPDAPAKPATPRAKPAGPQRPRRPATPFATDPFDATAQNLAGPSRVPAIPPYSGPGIPSGKPNTAFEGLAMQSPLREKDAFSDVEPTLTNDAAFGGPQLNRGDDFSIPESDDAAARLGAIQEKDFAEDDFWNRTDEEDGLAPMNFVKPRAPAAAPPAAQTAPASEPEPEPQPDAKFEPQPEQPLEPERPMEPEPPPLAAPAQAGGPAAAPPPKKKRRLRIPFLMPALLVAIGAALAAIWYLIPTPAHITGKLTFINFEWTAGTADSNDFAATQRRLLSDEGTRLHAIDALRQTHPSLSAGFLEIPALYSRAISTFDLSSIREGTMPQTVAELTYDGNDPEGDRARMGALLQSMIDANGPVLDNNRRLLDAVQQSERAVYDASQKLDQIKGQMADAQLVIDRQVSPDNLAQVAARKTELQHEKFTVEDRLDADRNALARLQAATVLDASAAPAGTGGNTADPQLTQMRQQLADLTAEVDAARSDQAAGATLARQQLEASEKGFSDQLSTAAAALGSSDQLREFLDSAKDAQFKARELIDNLIVDGQDLEKQLENTRRDVEDMIQSRQAEKWAADGELQDLQANLDSAQHRYNANVGQGVKDPSILVPLQREIDDSTAKVKARQAELGVDPNGVKIEQGLNSLIQSLRDKLDQERQDIDEVLDPLQKQMADLDPVVAALPGAQQNLARQLHQRLDGLNEARRKYEQAVGEDPMAPSAKVTQVQRQIDELKARFDRRQADLTGQMVKSLDAQPAQDLAAAQDRVNQDQKDLEAARKAYDEARVAMDEQTAARDAVDAAQQKIIRLTDDKTAAIGALATSQHDHDEKQAEAERAYDIKPLTDADITVSAGSDPRMIYSLMVTGAGLLCFAALAVQSHSRSRRLLGARRQGQTPVALPPRDRHEDIEHDLPDDDERPLAI